MTDDPTPTTPSDGPGEDDERRLRDLLRAASEGNPPQDGFAAVFAVRRRVRRRRMLRAGVSGCLAAGLILGVVTASATSSHRPPPSVSGELTPPVRLTGALVSFNGCSDYLDYVKARAEALVGAYGLQSTPYPVSNDAVGYASVSGAPASSGTAVRQAGPLASGNGVPALPSTSSSFSQTNDQVAGVDEPDSVKTDGHIVVTLNGTTLRVLDGTAQVLGTLQMAGDTGGGFLLDGDQVVVLSSASTAVPATGIAMPAYQPYGDLQPAPSSPEAQAAVVDVSNPSNPRLVRTFRFDGSIVAARLVGQQVRLVLRSDGPRLSFATAAPGGDTSASTAANKRLIADSTIGDWLPAWQVESPDGATTARQPLTTCDTVARPDQASGISTVTVLSLDPTGSAPGPGTSVVAAGDTVYATADRLYVAGPSAGVNGQTPLGVQSGCCSVAPPAGATTRIYAFDTPAAGAASFAGAGTVPGWLINSYAMDEDAQGRLRVASTWVASGGTSQSQITVLAPTQGQLTAVGSVAGLGNGEYLRAVRFLGDQAYVVTFRTFDPLYVVDLSNPAKPVLAGELDQPGFSEFLYPLPGHRLLGVGVQLTNSEPSGLVVATYDVSDPTHPKRIDESALAQGFFAQGYDPHAFLYWPPVDLALLALPDGPEYGGAAVGVAAYQIGAGGSLTRTATLGHGSSAATRSVVIGDQVWVITGDGIVTAHLTDLPATTWHPY